MHYLIVGNMGMLGRCLTRVLSKEKCRVTGTDIQEFDITDREKTSREIQRIRPDVLINCAAYTDVDGCEMHQEEAYAVNATGPGNLAWVLSKIGARLIHISTDFVFDGQKQSPYSETDPTGPLSIYGRSKLKGEEAIAEAMENYLIVRTSWLFGVDGNNFVKTMLKLADNMDRLEVVDDQKGRPTYARDLAEALKDLSRLEYRGIVHFSNSGECTWYRFACKIMEYAGKQTTILPTSTSRFPRPAQRPSNSAMDLTTVTRLLKRSPRAWEEALRDCIQAL